MGMDGEQSFASLIQRLELRSTAKPDIASLRSFYTWLYAEELITTTVARTPTAQESVFEIVMDDDEEAEFHEEEAVSQTVIAFPWLALESWDPVLKIGCYVMTILGVIRIAWVVAPVFEPALQRAYIDIAEFFQDDDNEPTPMIAEASSVTAERTVFPSKVEYVSMAGEIDRMKSLREKLAACRIRRDEYYLQNDENGYRTEVEAITLLTRKIGELELSD